MVDPRDIRIVETTPGGARRAMTGPGLSGDEFWNDGSARGGAAVSSIAEPGAIDMTGVASGEFQVNGER